MKCVNCRIRRYCGCNKIDCGEYEPITKSKPEYTVRCKPYVMSVPCYDLEIIAFAMLSACIGFGAFAIFTLVMRLINP